MSADGTATVRGRRARHVQEVLRAQSGDAFRVGVIGGRIGTARVVSMAPEEVTFQVDLTEDPPALPGIDLLIAMPRPKVLRRVLAMCASLGVGRLVLVNATRVEKSYFDSPLLQPEAMRDELVLGLEQGCDTHLPEVLIRDRFKPFVEDEVGTFWPDGSRVLAHPTARQSMRALTLKRPCVLAIGSEGGWTSYEASLLQTHGFEPISAGPRILRVETAIPLLFGQIAAQIAP